MATQKQIDFAVAVKPNLIDGLDRAQSMIEALPAQAPEHEAERSEMLSRLARIRTLVEGGDARNILNAADQCFSDASHVAKRVPTDKSVQWFAQNLSSRLWRVKLAGWVEKAERTSA